MPTLPLGEVKRHGRPSCDLGQFPTSKRTLDWFLYVFRSVNDVFFVMMSTYIYCIDLFCFQTSRLLDF